jgi:hypothetical protein
VITEEALFIKHPRGLVLNGGDWHDVDMATPMLLCACYDAVAGERRAPRRTPRCWSTIHRIDVAR